MSGNGEIVVEYISKMGGLLRDQDQLIKTIDKVVKGYDQITGATKTARAAMTEEQRYAQRVTQEHLTTAERLKQEQDRLTDAFVKTQISYVTYKRASQRIDQELLADAEKAKRIEEERARAADGRLQKEGGGLRALIADSSKAIIATAGVGSALAAVGTLAAIVKTDYDAWLSQRRESAHFGKEYSEIKSEALANAPAGMSGAQFDQIAQEIQQASGGRDLKKIAEGLGPQFSASATGSVDNFKQYMIKARALTRNDEAANALAMKGLSLGSSLGKADQVEDALGFTSAAQMQSKVTNAAQFAQPFGQVMANTEINHMGVREAAALFGTATRATADSDGSSSATATIQLMEQMKTIRTDLGLPANAKLDEVQAALQANKSVRRKWFGDGKRHEGKFTGEMKSRAFMRNWAEGGEWFQSYQAAKSQIPEFDDADAFYRDKVAQQRGDSTISAVASGDRLSGLVQEMVANPARIKQGTAIERFDELLKNAELPAFRRAQVQAQFEKNQFRMSTEEAAATALENEAEHLMMRNPNRASPYNTTARQFAEAAGELRGDPSSTADLVEVLRKIEQNTRRNGGQANGPPPNLQAPTPAP